MKCTSVRHFLAMTNTWEKQRAKIYVGSLFQWFWFILIWLFLFQGCDEAEYGGRDTWKGEATHLIPGRKQWEKGKSQGEGLPCRVASAVTYLLQLCPAFQGSNTPNSLIKILIYQWIKPLAKVEPSFSSHFPKAPPLHAACIGDQTIFGGGM